LAAADADDADADADADANAKEDPTRHIGSRKGIHASQQSTPLSAKESGHASH
jgi:hypothetical protein